MIQITKQISSSGQEETENNPTFSVFLSSLLKTITYSLNVLLGGDISVINQPYEREQRRTNDSAAFAFSTYDD